MPIILDDPKLAPSVTFHTWDTENACGEVRIYLGKIADHDYYPEMTAKRCAVDVEARINKNGYFAACCGVWNANGTDYNWCGQCLGRLGDHEGDAYPQLPDKSRKLLDILVPVWDKWHLNDWSKIDPESKGTILSIVRDALSLPCQKKAYRSIK